MFNNKTLAIIGAMDCEIDLVKKFLVNINKDSHSNFSIYWGNINNINIVLAKSGVGKVASASCTQYLIDKYKPDYIINTGVAGGIADNLKIYDIVIGTTFIQHDFDATALGYAKGYICNGIENQKPTIFYSDKKLVQVLQNSAKKILSDDNIHFGRIVSGDIFVADKEKKQEFKQNFNAIASEMESAAIAHCATLNNIPFVAIRAISDLADGTKIENYPEFEIEAAKISSSIIKNLLE